MHPKRLLAEYARRLETAGEIYKACKEIDGYPGEGSFVLAGARVFKRYWVANRQMFYEPLSSYDEIRTATLLKHRLREAYAPEWALDAIEINFRVFESISSAPQGRVALPKPAEADKGGHAVFMTGGWEDRGESLEFANSWGSNWGNNGYGYLSRSYLDQYMVDAWLARNARVGPTWFTIPRLHNATSNKEFAEAWMLQNPRWRKRFPYRGRGNQIINYETWSLASECRVDILEIRDGNGFLIAWAFLFHLRGEQRGVSLLKEFFVWPSYRRQGYGKILDSYVCEAVRRAHSTKVQVLFHDMDAQVSVRAAGRLFAEQVGYTWRWRQQRRPNVVAIGEKML